MRKAQSSVEYLFVVSLSLLLIIPASYLFLNQSSKNEEAIVSSQLTKIGNDLITSVQDVYVVGNQSYVTIEVYIPDHFANATIYSQSELVFLYNTKGGLSQLVFFSDVPIVFGDEDCQSTPCPLNLLEGRNNIRVTSRGGSVSIVRI